MEILKNLKKYCDLILSLDILIKHPKIQKNNI